MILTALLCLTTFAADEAVIATQAATGPKPQATSYGTEAISIPQMLSYQGRLTDSFGVPVTDTTYSVTFRLYDVLSGGSPLWSETQQFRTKTGLFSVLLGSVTPIDSTPAGGAAYVGMAIEGGSELAPRLRIASAAYSYLTAMAANSDRLQGKDTAAFAVAGHNHDATYVNEGQMNSVTTTMVVDGSITGTLINRMGAASGQVLKWTGSAWGPGDDSLGMGGGTVTKVVNATGVVCSPNPITDSGTVRFDTTWGDTRFVNEGQANSVTGAMIADGQVSSADIRDTAVNTADLKDNAVTSLKILDASITSADIRDTTVNAADLKDAAVTMAKINQAGATAGQVIKWTGSAWAPRNDSIGSGPGDNAWMRSGSDSVLYTVHPLGLAKAGSVLLGSARHTQVNFGAACTTGSALDDSFATVLGGKRNLASATYSAIGGGYGNLATGEHAVVAGGDRNEATGTDAAALGGGMNWVTGDEAVIGGGDNNHAHGLGSVVGGGGGNDAANDYSVIGGGESNDALGYYNTIGGGTANYADGELGTIGGGGENTATGDFATVAGGTVNSARSWCAVVGGGDGNTIADTADDATIAGGEDNSVEGEYGTIGGGQNNQIGGTAKGATIGGGEDHHANGYTATIGGGEANDAGGDGATVAGGFGNEASGEASTIAGGEVNIADSACATVGGGSENEAAGTGSTIAGGIYSTAAGYCSSVAGGVADSSYGDYSFTVGNASMVPADYDNSAAFNGTTASASNQVRVNSLVQGYGAFAVDDPRDPDRMILNQYSVASSEMVMVYRGSAVLGSNGRAEVVLPSYFDGLCRNPMVQLTGVGSADVVYIAEDVFGNNFTVGGKPGMKVYWTVTAERQDPTAEIGRALLPVEQAKTGALVGRSLDDAALAGAKKQLERMGLAADFDFRTAAGRQRYENAKQARTLGRRDHARTKVTDRRLACRQRIEERKRLSAERKAARRLQRKAEQHEGKRKSGIPSVR
jgi:hypothetical protein